MTLTRLRERIEQLRRYVVFAREHHQQDRWFASTEVAEDVHGNWLKREDVLALLDEAEREQPCDCEIYQTCPKCRAQETPR